MKLLKQIILIFPIFLLTSCYFQEFDGVRKNAIHERIFENSGNGKITNFDGENIADVKVVYLSDISKKFSKEDVFLFSTYVFDKEKRESILPKIEDAIFLNRTKPFKVEKINSRSKVLKLIRVSNPWYENYLLYFEKQEKEELNLVLYLKNYRYTKVKILKGSGEKRLYPTILEKLQGEN
jgi:hypothetical protein